MGTWTVVHPGQLSTSDDRAPIEAIGPSSLRSGPLMVHVVPLKGCPSTGQTVL